MNDTEKVFYVWWTGILIDKHDPLMMGRAKVRIKGIHSDNVADVPNEDLPWASALYGVNAGSSMLALKEGDNVMGFFMDGRHSQYPVIVGKLQNIPENSPEQAATGFVDPGFNMDKRPRIIESVKYNLDGLGATVKNGEGTTYPRDYNQPSTSKIARKEDLDNTIVNRKNESVINVPAKPEKAKLDCPFDGFTEFFSDMKQMAKDAMKKLASAISPIASFLADIADLVSGGIAAAKAAIAKVMSTLTDLENAALNALKDAANAVIDKVKGAFDDDDFDLDTSFITEAYAKLSAMYDNISKTVSDFLHSPCIEAFTDQLPNGINIPNIHDVLDTTEFNTMLDELTDSISGVMPDNAKDLSNSKVLAKTLSVAMSPMDKKLGDYFGSKITSDLISTKFAQNLESKSIFDLKKIA